MFKCEAGDCINGIIETVKPGKVFIINKIVSKIQIFKQNYSYNEAKQFCQLDH